MLRIILLCVVAVGSTHAAAATRVELKIDELRPIRTVAWPITTGMPFPRDGLTAEMQCRLVDDLGQEQLLQTKVAATWDAAKSSIRWLTIDFIAQPGRKYAIEFGPDVVRTLFPPSITIGDIDDVVVNTGPLDVEFSRKGPAALGSVRIDFNGDGSVAPDERVATGPKTGDHVFTDQNDVASAGSRDGNDRVVVVETTGPVRTCVRVDGWYTGPNGERIVRYRTRYHMFAGLPLVKIIDEFRIVDSTRETRFADIAMPLELNLGGSSRRITARLGDEAIEKALWSQGSASLRQETYRHYGNLECRAKLEATHIDGGSGGTTDKAGPWMQISDDRVAVTGSLRWFSQQFPKEWETNGDRLTLHLWSPKVEPLDFGEAGIRKFFGPAGAKYLFDWKAAGTRNPITDFFYYAGHHALERDGADGLGINKHHEIWYHFGPADQAKDGREYGELADAQPLCLATGEWNVSTDVFGPLAARPNDSPYEAIVDKVFELERYAQDAFGDYGWFLFGAGPHYSYQWDAETKKHYADPRRFEYHTYQRETQLWWSYFRSGERKFYDWAIPSENHWVDIAVSHAPTMYSTEWRGGARGEAKLHYPKGDWSIDSPLHYVRHHDTGEAWLRSASQYWATYHRTLETTTLAYYLTGDERYNDVVQFWKEYWSPLAGVRSDMQNGGEPWHRDQMWWQPTKPGEPSKSWAEMIRDYAPFQSGSRHQQTLFFNLSTLYEHTWDPTVKQVLDEYAAAFLDHAGKNGVWQCQDHRLPANADSPMLAHYWAPALWKYARATGDPRMPEILKKYFTACIEADPYGCDVGIYSNNQIAWGWYFTKDPRFLVAAQQELDDLMPNAAPLAKPEDLNRRIYNPYAPIKSLAATPRLIGILEDAKRLNIAAPQTPPLSPQRAPIAFRRPDRPPHHVVFWGWDPTLQVIDSAGRPIAAAVATTENRSHRQPFDRAIAGYKVYRHEVTLPPLSTDARDPWYFVLPRTELGILENGKPWCCAAEPLSIEPRRRWHWRRPKGIDVISIETSSPIQLRFLHNQWPLTATVAKNRITVSLADLPEQATLTIENSGEKRTWFRVVDMANDNLWMAPELRAVNDAIQPSLSSTTIAHRQRSPFNPAAIFVPGKFGEGLLLVAGRELRIPDEIDVADGTKRRLSGQRQGTMEFWIRRLWDDRVAPGPASMQLMNAGSLFANCPTPNLKLDDWTHVAIIWRPMPDGSDRSLVHAYFDGVDYAFYRSLYWEGYGSKPAMLDPAKTWLKEFITKGYPGAMFVIDDVRVSTEPRYVNLGLDFGRQQTINPDAFTPSDKPAEFDGATVVLLPLDGDLRGNSFDGRPFDATLQLEKRPEK